MSSETEGRVGPDKVRIQSRNYTDDRSFLIGPLVRGVICRCLKLTLKREKG